MVFKATPARGEKYGKGRHAITTGGLALANDLQQALRDTFASDSYTPPHLPRAATEILALSRRPDMRIDDVVKLLEEDGMLAGKVLKVAASPAYAGTARLTSLRQAVVRLGIANLRDIVFEVAMKMTVFRAPGLEQLLDQVWKHCRTTAYISRIVCRYASLDAELAFLCGLLHDIGAAGAIMLLAADKRVDANAPQTLDAIRAVHLQAGETMTRRWGLDFDIQHAVGHHHHLEDPIHPMAAVVCIAEGTAAGLGFKVPKQLDDGSQVDFGAARKALGFTDKSFEAFWADCEKQKDQLAD
jgi:putative nucleotidyltransferase with HDIG domain